eukprot:scaffold195439_cov32-Prasinocladus_malaysianus.AAC.2
MRAFLGASQPEEGRPEGSQQPELSSHLNDAGDLRGAHARVAGQPRAGRLASHDSHAGARLCGGHAGSNS